MVTKKKVSRVGGSARLGKQRATASKAVADSETCCLVRWRGGYWLLIGDSIAGGGPLCSRAQYVNGELSEAQLNPNGTIFRYRQQIGTAADVKFVRRVKLPKQVEGAWVSLLCNALERM